MEFIIGILLAAKSIFIVSGSLGTGTSHVRFSPPTFRTAQGQLMMECRVVNAFNPDLRTLAASGTEILLYLFVDVRRDGERKARISTIAENRLRYDALAGTYLVARLPLGDTVQSPVLDSALIIASTFNKLRIASARDLPKEGQYRFVIQAVLGKARIEALENSSVDLMYFWGFRRPMIATESYSFRELFPDRSTTP